ncbi:DNA recombination protein RmuC [Patescibacteria group bacterium]|nr:DNA recombination protein RmuC [Patescibacteria group bacterium]
MDATIFITVILALIILGLLAYVILKINDLNASKHNSSMDTALAIIQKELENVKATQSQQRTDIQDNLHQLNDRLFKSQSELRQASETQFSTMHQQSNAMGKTLQEVSALLSHNQSTITQVLDYSKQLQDLQSILKNPKQRGVLGEYFLETALKNVLAPANYEMQYKFPNGDIVDAVIKIKDRVIPIDAKFSLENYNRLVDAPDEQERERVGKLLTTDLKNRILETSKYVRPEEGTLDFAFMFIPHEALYYDLLVNKVGALQEDTESLIARAAAKYRVIVVSPTSFFAYLQTVLQGLNAMRIEESALEIKKHVENMKRHVATYSRHQESVQKALSTTVNQFNGSTKAFEQIVKDVSKITEQPVDGIVDVEAVARPMIEGE